MTVDELLRERYAASGPLPFSEFMRIALYAPGCGYYTRGVDVWGPRGDFYTASQIPVYGRLVRLLIEPLLAGSKQIVELGPGRGDLRAAFADLEYVGVEAGDEMPHVDGGVVFSNELWDALPVDVAVCRGDGVWMTRLVEPSGNGWRWCDGDADERGYLRHHFPHAADGDLAEVPVDMHSLVNSLGAHLHACWLVSVDYGYTSPELSQRNLGTHLSIRQHRIVQDVLARPGEQDITAHVNFDVLASELARVGFVSELKTLTQWLLELDDVAVERALQAGGHQQLQHLITHFGDRFRVLLSKK